MALNMAFELRSIEIFSVVVVAMTVSVVLGKDVLTYVTLLNNTFFLHNTYFVGD